MKPALEAGGTGLLALGNVLYADDGVGPYALEFLQSRWTLPAGVTAEDLGTPGPGLGAYLLGFDRVLVLDSVRGTPAGSLYRWSTEECSVTPPSRILLPHEPSLREAVAITRLRGQPVEVVVLGVRAESLALGMGLSRVVLAAVPTLVELAVEQLAAWGMEPYPRPGALPFHPWWEAPRAVASAS